MFRLIQDNDDHWFVIQAEDEAKFLDWVDAVENGSEKTADFYYQEVDGPHSVVFPRFAVG